MATSFGARMVRAAKLDRAVYEELEKDRTATGQAAAVVVLVAVATGIGLGAGLRGLAASGIWMLVATVIAVRQALDYQSLPRAVAVCLIGWIAQMAVFFLLTRSAGPV